MGEDTGVPVSSNTLRKRVLKADSKAKPKAPVAKQKVKAKPAKSKQRNGKLPRRRRPGRVYIKMDEDMRKMEEFVSRFPCLETCFEVS